MYNIINDEEIADIDILLVDRISEFYDEVYWNVEPITIDYIRTIDWDYVVPYDKPCVPSYTGCHMTNEEHLGRIKWLINNGWNDAIEIDALYTWFRIDDGNHRFLASVAMGNKTIKCKFSGDCSLLDYLSGKTDEKDFELMC